MNKKLIALAIAGALAAPMAAQAEVTISGLLQAEVSSVSGDGAVEGIYLTDGMEGATQNSGNASAINISASEDLGGGMKAIAKVGYNLWPADHNDRDFQGRDAYVGLAGGFGTVLLGTMNAPYKSSTVKWDPFLTTSMQARGSYGMSAQGHNGYAQNAIAYANNFGSVKLVAAVVLDETSDDDPTELDGDNATSVSVNFPVGPVEIAAAYADGGGDDEVLTKIGVKWSGGPLTVAGQYEMLDEGIAFSELDRVPGVDLVAMGATPADVGSANVVYLTASMAMGNNTFSASFGQTSYDDADDADSTYAAIGVKHAFSKTVSAHVGYRASDTDVDDTDVSVLTAGMRVGF